MSGESSREELVENIRSTREGLKQAQLDLDSAKKRLTVLVLKAKSRLVAFSQIIELGVPWDDISSTWSELVQIFGMGQYQGGDYNNHIKTIESCQSNVDYRESALAKYLDELNNLNEE